MLLKKLNLSYLNKQKGFTLSEVLIVLTILGIVASICIPNLVRHSSQRINFIKFKKTISIVSQALKRNYALHGFDLSSIYSNCLDKKSDDISVGSVCSIFNNSVILQIKEDYLTYKNSDGKLYYVDLYKNGVAADTKIRDQGVQLYYYGINDGSMLIFHSPHVGNKTVPVCTLNDRTIESAAKDNNFVKYCLAWIDVNGGQKPNKEVRCKDNKAYYGNFSVNCEIDEGVAYDVFPIFMYDSTVIPATAAALKAMKN